MSNYKSKALLRKKRIRKWFWEYKKTQKCSICGEDHVATLEFHHKNTEEKEITISNAIKHGYSIAEIKKELSKTITVCANCHRKIHWEINPPVNHNNKKYNTYRNKIYK